MTSVTEQALWRVDIVAKTVHRWFPAADRHDAWRLPAKVGCFVPCADGVHGAAALPDGLHLLDLDSVGLTRAVAIEADIADNLFNDGKCDRQGNFWLGSKHAHDEPGKGFLYRVDRRGRVQRLLSGISTSNGIGWSPDDRICYYTDSGARTIWAMRVDDSGVISRCVFAEDSQGFPDGLTVDAQGYVWSAKWDGARVVRYAPDGAVDLTLAMPVTRPTSVMFGGADLGDLYITSASIGVEHEPLAGHVFVYRSITRSIAETPFTFDSPHGETL